MALVLFPVLVDPVDTENVVYGLLDHEGGVHSVGPIRDDFVRRPPGTIGQGLPMPAVTPRGRGDEPLHLGIRALHAQTALGRGIPPGVFGLWANFRHVEDGVAYRVLPARGCKHLRWANPREG